MWRRERHILPSVEQTLAQLGGATVFSKLDANSGFWQIELTKESALLTTFITPYGRYCFNRLPFGITSAPETFRARQSVWWPGINKDIEVMISKCLICCKHKKQNTEPLKPTPFPEYPWQKVAIDLFEWKKTTYVLVVDYYSRYIEVCCVPSEVLVLQVLFTSLKLSLLVMVFQRA